MSGKTVYKKLAAEHEIVKNLPVGTIEELVDEEIRLERNRCLKIALDQYAYWRELNPKDKLIQDFATGAMGASANLYCEILGIVAPMGAKAPEGT